jgi:hypothetical protein
MLPENATTDDQFTPELIQLKLTKQIKTVQLLFHLLPAENSTVLECILKLLHKVVEEEENKMTAETLGTLFAPHILCPKKVGISLCYGNNRFSFLFKIRGIHWISCGLTSAEYRDCKFGCQMCPTNLSQISSRLVQEDFSWSMFEGILI